MNEATVALLFQRQQPRSVRLESFAMGTEIIKYDLADLEEFRFGSLSTDPEVISWMGDTLALNIRTLRHLELGAEDLFRDDKDSGVDMTRELTQELETRLDEIYECCPNPVLSLSSLTLVGLSLLDLVDSCGQPAVDWTNLRRLALKSCWQLDSTINFLQSAIVKSDGSGESVNLKSFDLRSDRETNPANVVDALKRFLTSFNGLVHLGILLEDNDTASSMLPFILKSHGPTLKRLIWDVRVEERTSFMLDVSRAQSRNAHVRPIVKRCHLLEELGISFDWSKLMDPIGRLGTLEYVRQLTLELIL